MQNHFKEKNTSFLIFIFLLLIPGFISAQSEIIELQFKQSSDTGSDTTRTLESLVKVQGTGQFKEDGLYLMTHYGDRGEIFKKENEELIDNPFIDQTWRHCSIFSTSTANSVLMGRNWDNQNVGSIIVNYYNPPNGYASISFCRSIDLGFGHKDLEDHKSSIFGPKLLLAPFYAYDGINEQGLSVAVAGVKHTTINPQSDKELVFVPLLARKILDHTENIEESVNMVEKYIPFDIDKNSLNTHFYIVDASGKSVILEYADNKWHKIYGDKSWQVLTNKSIYNDSDTKLRDKCWRYRSISETLENTHGNVDWRAGMKIMQDVTQKGTTWSAVYSPTKKEIYFCVYQNWDKIYHFTGF